MLPSSSWTSLLPTSVGAPFPSALHLFWKLQLGQRICLLLLFVSVVRFLELVLHQWPPGAEAICASIYIRFPTTRQWMVPPFLPSSQPGQARIVPATDDGSGTRLLDGARITLVHNVFIFFPSRSKVMIRRYSAAAVFTITPRQRGPGFPAFSHQNRPSASTLPGQGSDLIIFLPDRTRLELEHVLRF